MLNEVYEFVKSIYSKNKINFSKILLVVSIGFLLYPGIFYLLNHAFNSSALHGFRIVITEYSGLLNVFYKAQLLMGCLSAFVALRLSHHISLNKDIEMQRVRAVQWLQECYQHLKSRLTKVQDSKLQKDNRHEKAESKSFVTKLLVWLCVLVFDLISQTIILGE